MEMTENLKSEFRSIAVMIFVAMPLALAITNPSDVEALLVLYTALNRPSQLTGWRSSGGDPCREFWRGVACEGSAVVSIDISGLGLGGTTGDLLSNLMSLRHLDLSNNNIHDTIPYQLPPNLSSLNIGSNKLSGNRPYSIYSLSCNFFERDLSFNNFSGDLPSSFSSLSNLSSLYLQNNQLTGSLTVLVDLPLNVLNVANNHFIGSIPRELSSIQNFLSHGNSFEIGPTPPLPPPYTSLLPISFRTTGIHIRFGSAGAHGSHRSGDEDASRRQSTSEVWASVGVVLGSLAIALVLFALYFCVRKWKHREGGTRIIVSSGTNNATSELQEQMVKISTVNSFRRCCPAERLMSERVHVKNGSMKRTKSTMIATSYTLDDLQYATKSFSQELLIGESSLGRVYKAEFPNGKVMAIKKIDTAALSLQDEDNFLEAVSNVSSLSHPNIVALAGFCAEHGHQFLVYEHIGNRNLHDMLHCVDDSFKALSWNARIQISLGIARALEYLHEACLPSVIHGNLKSSNILLDEKLNPHLSDCGLTALTPYAERQVATQMFSPFGYGAPEFASSGIHTVKTDVYSFGVVMLELLTGRKPLDSSRDSSEEILVRWAAPKLHDMNALTEMADPVLNGMYTAKSLSRFADIVALCVQPEPEFRPPMSEIVQALTMLVQRASSAKQYSTGESSFAFEDRRSRSHGHATASIAGSFIV